jgi:hypothetical protein
LEGRKSFQVPQNPRGGPLASPRGVHEVRRECRSRFELHEQSGVLGGLDVTDLVFVGDGGAQKWDGALPLPLPREEQAEMPAALRFAGPIADLVQERERLRASGSGTPVAVSRRSCQEI